MDIIHLNCRVSNGRAANDLIQKLEKTSHINDYRYSYNAKSRKPVAEYTGYIIDRFEINNLTIKYCDVDANISIDRLRLLIDRPSLRSLRFYCTIYHGGDVAIINNKRLIKILNETKNQNIRSIRYDSVVISICSVHQWLNLYTTGCKYIHIDVLNTSNLLTSEDIKNIANACKKSTLDRLTIKINRSDRRDAEMIMAILSGLEYNQYIKKLVFTCNEDNLTANFDVVQKLLSLIENNTSIEHLEFVLNTRVRIGKMTENVSDSISQNHRNGGRLKKLKVNCLSIQGIYNASE